MNVLPFSLRHLAKTPPYFPMSGLCMDLRRFLGDHASGWLGKLCPRAVWDFVHIGLVASTSLCVRTELRHVHPILLPRTPGWHHCLLLCHDHLQGEVLFKRSFPLWRSHQKQPQPWDQTYKGNKGLGLKVAKKKWCILTVCDLFQVAMLICAGFLIAWIPYAVVSVVSAFGEPDSIPIPVSVIPTLLAKSSAMYNPIIYQLVDLKNSCSTCCSKVIRKRTHFRNSR